MDVVNTVVEEVGKYHPHPEIYQHVGHFGRSVLWVTFFSFAITFILFAFKTFSLKPSERANAYTSLFIVAIAGIAYYSMATGLGVTKHIVVGDPHHYRQLFYARYIDWIFTTPLLLLDLILISGLDLGSTLWIVGADVAMIVTGLFGALEGGAFKWGWFLAGDVFLVFVIIGILGNARTAAFSKNSEVGQLYSGLSISLMVLWVIYPIIWAFSEGKAAISSNAEVLGYAVLDILAKIVFSTILFVKHDTVASATSVPSGLDGPLLGSTADEVTI